MNISLYQDGACNNNAKHLGMGIGVAVYFDKIYQSDLSLAEGYLKGWFGEECTSSVAEWSACVAAMQIAGDLKDKGIIKIYSDSKNVVNQFNGTFPNIDPKFKHYFDGARKFAHNAGIKLIEWIERDYNKQADILSKQGLKSLITTQFNTNVKATR